jgi:ABC-type polysaccharide/polyol phosphate export permease
MAAIALHHRELFANLVRREIRGRYKGSWLGVTWTLVLPVVMMGAYTLVFSVIFRVVANVPNYPLFVLTGLSLWVFFAGSLTVAATSLIGNANLVKKVRFPRVMVPMASVVSQALTMAVIVAILIPFNLWQMPGDRRAMLLLPLVLLAICMLVVGLAIAISVLNVFLRDIEHIVGALLLPWFFLTPILFTLESFPLGTTQAWTVDALRYGNFVTPFVLALQDALYWGAWPSPQLLAYVLVVGGGVLVGGWLLFRRMERDLAIEL